jgi:hypothetical protein
MTQPPNPIAQGFRAARRDPATFLLEILWRWSFAIIALLLVFVAGSALPGKTSIGNMLLAAWRTQNARMMGALGLSLLLQPKELMMALIALVAFGLAVGFLWSLFAAAARRIVIRRLSSGEPLGFRAMLAVQWLRGMVALLSLLLMIAAVVGAIYAATLGGHTDLFRFYLVCAPSLPLVLILWLAMNWRLSMAAIFGKEGQGFRAALRQAGQIVRRQRSDFAGTAFIFLLLRTVALLAVAALAGLTSSMMATSPQAYVALVMTMALGYFAVSDFLYVARAGAYLALAAARADITVEFSSAQ